MFGAEKVTMQLRKPGYLRPNVQQHLSPEEERQFEDTCPGVRLDLPETDAATHPIWGPIIKVRVGAATDNVIRHEGSSGGVLSALLCYLLEQDKVQSVVHTAASSDTPIMNDITVSQNRQSVLHGAGSRYGPSAPLETLHRCLDDGNTFCLVGKPCDIAGARALARHDPRVDRNVPFMVSFFCAGVPSLAGTREILKQMNVNEDDLQTFRYRGDGWPGTAKAVKKNGQMAEMSYADSWGGILSNHTQFRCKVCPDGTGNFADVACGDAWLCDDEGYPLFDEDDGRSLIVTRTLKGEEMVQAAMAAGYIDADEIEAADIDPMQPGQLNRKKLVLARLLAVRLFGSRYPVFKGQMLRAAASRASVFLQARNFLGTCRRLLKNRQ